MEMPTRNVSDEYQDYVRFIEEQLQKLPAQPTIVELVPATFLGFFPYRRKMAGWKLGVPQALKSSIQGNVVLELDRDHFRINQQLFRIHDGFARNVAYMRAIRRLACCLAAT